MLVQSTSFIYSNYSNYFTVGSMIVCGTQAIEAAFSSIQAAYLLTKTSDSAESEGYRHQLSVGAWLGRFLCFMRIKYSSRHCLDRNGHFCDLFYFRER